MTRAAREAAYRIDPVLWAKEVLGIAPWLWAFRTAIGMSALPPKSGDSETQSVPSSTAI
jgi:hypothetical protein